MLLTNSSLSTSVSKERVNKTMKNISGISPSILNSSVNALNKHKNNNS